MKFTIATAQKVAWLPKLHREDGYVANGAGRVDIGTVVSLVKKAVKEPSSNNGSPSRTSWPVFPLHFVFHIEAEGEEKRSS